MEFERSVVTFQVLTGGKESGLRMVRDLESLAIKSPYRTRQLEPLAGQLLGAGASQEQVLPMLGRLGDIAGGDPERLRLLTKAMGDVISAGRFLGQERRQCSNSGVGVGEFAKTMGISVPEFLQQMEQGKIGVYPINDTVNRLTGPGGRFNRLSSTINETTVFGQYNSMMEKLEALQRRIMADGPNGLFAKLGIVEGFRALNAEIDRLDTEKIASWLGNVADLGKRVGEGLWGAANALTEIGKGVFSQATWDTAKSGIEGFVESGMIGFASLAKVISSVGIEIAIITARASKLFEFLGDTTLGRKLSDLANGKINMADGGPLMVANMLGAGIELNAVLDKPQAGNPIDNAIGELMAARDRINKTDPVAAAREAMKKARAFSDSIDPREKAKQKLIASMREGFNELNPLTQMLNAQRREDFANLMPGAQRMRLIDSMREGFGAFYKKDAEGNRLPAIPRVKELPSEVTNYAKEMKDKLKDGETPFQLLMKNNELAERAFRGIPDGAGGRLRGFNEEQYRAALYQNYMTGMGAFGGRLGENRLSTGPMIGSSEAQDTINRSSMQQLDLTAQIARDMAAMKEINQQMEAHMKAAKDALVEMQKQEPAKLIKVEE